MRHLFRSSLLLGLAWTSSVCWPAVQTSSTRQHSFTSNAAWETLPTEAYAGKRDDISFADLQDGWYGTGRGDLFRTIDGGRSWRKVSSHPGTFIRSLAFVDPKLGFIGNVGTGYYPGVTDETPLYRTDDGGTTWKPITLNGGKVAGICSIDVLRTKRLYQGRLRSVSIITAAGRVGGPAAIARSTDGGQTWRTIDMSRWTGMILDVHFVDEQTGFVAASSSRDVATTNAQVLMTRDGGESWSEVYRSKRPGELIWKLSFPTATTAYGTVMSQNPANENQVAIKTIDGGKTWKEIPLVHDKRAVELGVGFVDANHGWIGTMVGGFETTDGGRSFHRAPIAPAANKFRILRTASGSAIVYSIGTQVQRAVVR